jgi:predicted nucleic acid-binding protein
VLVDTSAIYAVVSAADEFHREATAAYRGLILDRMPLYVTSYILAESYSLVWRRFGPEALRSLVESTRGEFQVVWIDQTIHWEAWDAMSETKGRSLSFVDWSTVIVARRLGAAVFSFDSDFAGQGLVCIPGKPSSTRG